MPVQSIQTLDDQLLLDGNDSFVGGQVSASRANLIPEDAFVEGKNIDLDAFGSAVTRRGADLSVGYLIWEQTTSEWQAETSSWNGVQAPVTSCAYFDTGTNEYIILADGDDYLKASAGSGEITPITAADTAGSSNVRFAQLGTRLYFTAEDATASSSQKLRYISSALSNNAITAGKVTSVTMTEEGAGYASAPTVTFSSPTSGSTATGDAVMGYGGKIVDIDITSGGSGYDNSGAFDEPPSVAITAAGSGGTDATATVNISQTPSKPKLLVSHTNRLFATSWDTSVPADTVYVSDILDGESWDLAGNNIRVGDDGDPIIAMMPWQDFNLLVFKERSIWMVVADPTKSVSAWDIKLVNNRVGCIAERTVQQVGADVYFLARDGLRSVQTIQAGTQTDISLPISSPINDYIGRINQAKVGLCSGIYWRNRYMLAVPLDSATTPNTVLVFHLLTKSWAGHWDGWEPRQFVISAFDGELKLNIATQQGEFYTWDDTKPDSETTSADFKDGPTGYESYIITRAYRFGETWGDKIGYSAQFNLENIHSEAITSNFYYYKDLSSTATALASSVSLTASTNLIRKGYNLTSKGRFNQIQFKIQADSGRLSLHSVESSAFGQAIMPQR